jgi:hypothetical protein
MNLQYINLMKNIMITYIYENIFLIVSNSIKLQKITMLLIVIMNILGLTILNVLKILKMI